MVDGLSWFDILLSHVEFCYFKFINLVDLKLTKKKYCARFFLKFQSSKYCAYKTPHKRGSLLASAFRK